MPTFIITGKYTDQGVRTIKDAPKRAQAARDLGKKLGVEVKHIFLTSGESDLLVIVETANPDAVVKFNMIISGQGNLRTKTVRGWPEAEFFKLVSELP